MNSSDFIIFAATMSGGAGLLIAGATSRRYGLCFTAAAVAMLTTSYATVITAAPELSQLIRPVASMEKPLSLQNG